MKGAFFAGITCGALLGSILLEASPETKKLVQQGKDLWRKKVLKKERI